jgi:hypothetical protein
MPTEQVRYFFLMDLVCSGKATVFQLEGYVVDETWQVLLPMAAKNMKATSPEKLTSPTDIWGEVPTSGAIVALAAQVSDDLLFQNGAFTSLGQRPSLSRILHAEIRRCSNLK